MQNDLAELAWLADTSHREKVMRCGLITRCLTGCQDTLAAQLRDKNSESKLLDRQLKQLLVEDKHLREQAAEHEVQLADLAFLVEVLLLAVTAVALVSRLNRWTDTSTAA